MSPTVLGSSPKSYTLSFVKIGPLLLEKKILKDFYHILAWLPYLSFEPDAAKKLSFPLSMEAQRKI